MDLKFPDSKKVRLLRNLIEIVKLVKAVVRLEGQSGVDMEAITRLANQRMHSQMIHER